MSDALTWLGWLAVAAIGAAAGWHALARSDEPGRLAWRWVGTVATVAGMWFYATRIIGFEGRGGHLGNFGAAALLAGGIAVGGIVLGMIWGSTFGRWIARPLAGFYDDGGQELRPAPCYSSAIAHRIQGRTSRALEEIHRQLQRFPDDLEGVLLMAEIQAIDLHDVPLAEITLETWLADPRRTSAHRAIAYTKLADWHMQILHDPDGARRFLEGIVKTAPDSEAAFLAEQRLAHLQFEAQPQRGPLRVTTGAGKPVDVGVPPPVPERLPDTEAAQLAQQLQVHPHDVAARERLAALQGWDFGRPDLARAELEILIGFPQASEREIVHWLNLLADLEVQIAKDPEAARAALQRIVDRNPNVAAAEQARQRIRFLPRELNRHRSARTIRSQGEDHE